MKRAFFVILPFLILLACKPNASTTFDKQSEPELKEKVDEYFTALHGLGKFNGVIFASKNNVEIIHKAYNLNQSEDSSTYVSPESQFDIHSVSKLMAHYLIERYELEGKLSKQQSIDKFIPDFPNGEKITIEMLLSHTSGLPRSYENIEEDEINWSSAQIIEYSKEQELLFEPGTSKQYSNVAYELVYFIIQEISNKTFAQCLSDEVFQVLNMQQLRQHEVQP